MNKSKILGKSKSKKQDAKHKEQGREALFLSIQPKKGESGMTADLTRGKPLKQIFLFAVPFLIGNLFQQLYNVVDMVIVGRFVNPEAYAAVASTGSIVWLTIGTIGPLTVGFSTVTAAYFGAKDIDGVKRSFAHAIIWTFIVSAIASVLFTVFARDILEIMNTPSDIIDRSYNYLTCMFSALVITAFYNLFSNMIRALGDSKTPLYFLIFSCVANIILDIVFVLFFKLDTLGVGIATVIAQFLSTILCILHIKRKLPELHMVKNSFAEAKSDDKRLLSIGLPMALLNMVTAFGGIVVQFAINGFGTDYVSAQATGGKIESFNTLPIISIGSAIAVFVAQNLGAGKNKRVIQGIGSALFIGAVWCLISAVILLPFGNHIVRLIAGQKISEEVVSNAHLFIIINCSLSIIMSTLHIAKCALQALGKSIVPLISGFLEIGGRAGIAFFAIYLVNSSILQLQDGFKIICFANPIAWVVAILLIVPYALIALRAIRKKAKSETD